MHGGHLCISMVSRLFGECQRSFELSFRICVRRVSGCVRLSQNIIQNMRVRCGCMAAICVLAWYLAYSVSVSAPSNYHSGYVCVWCLVVSGAFKISFRICEWCRCMAAICVLAWYLAYSVNVGAPSNNHSGFVCVWCLVVSGSFKISFRICV